MAQRKQQGRRAPAQQEKIAETVEQAPEPVTEETVEDQVEDETVDEDVIEDETEDGADDEGVQPLAQHDEDSEDGERTDPEAGNEIRTMNLAGGGMYDTGLVSGLTYDRLYPFDKYEDVVGDRIRVLETVYYEFTYPGSQKIGKAIAYSAGTIVPKSVLENIMDDEDEDESDEDE